MRLQDCYTVPCHPGPGQDWRLSHDMEWTADVPLQGKHKATKFTCKQRAALLTVLYQCVAAAGGSCPISRKVLASNSSQTHAGLKQTRWLRWACTR